MADLSSLAILLAVDRWKKKPSWHKNMSRGLFADHFAVDSANRRLHHAAHSAHSTHSAHSGSAATGHLLRFVFGLFGNHGLGGQH